MTLTKQAKALYIEYLDGRPISIRVEVVSEAARIARLSNSNRIGRNHLHIAYQIVKNRYA